MSDEARVVLNAVKRAVRATAVATQSGDTLEASICAEIVRALLSHPAAVELAGDIEWQHQVGFFRPLALTPPPSLTFGGIVDRRLLIVLAEARRITDATRAVTLSASVR